MLSSTTGAKALVRKLSFGRRKPASDGRRPPPQEAVNQANVLTGTLTPQCSASPDWVPELPDEETVGFNELLLHPGMALVSPRQISE